MAASKPFAVIAGVGTGTGSAVARRFAQAYSIVVLARNPNNYQEVVDDINSSGGKAVGISADVTDAASVQNAFGHIAKEFGESNLAASIYNVGGVSIKFCRSVIRFSSSAVYITISSCALFGNTGVFS